MNKNQQISQLTVAQFLELMKKSGIPLVINQSSQDDDIIRGIKGLASFLGMSTSKIQQLKSSGMFDGAMTQIGRNIFFNKRKIINIINRENNLEKDSE